MNKTILSIVVIALSLISLGFVSADVGDFGCPMMGGMYGGYGVGIMLFSWSFAILVLVALVLLIIWLIKQIQKK